MGPLFKVNRVSRVMIAKAITWPVIRKPWSQG